MEYPKCLYLGGDVEADYILVADAEQEAQQRAAGYRTAYEVDAAPRRKKGA